MSIEELQGCGQGGANYPIDIVFCLDVTGSMQGCIDNAKKMALQFKDDLLEKMKELGKNCTGGIRVKVIAFRDLTMGEKMQISPFFKMPDQEGEFKDFVNGLVAQGGGPEPESSYEALLEAINSDWVKEGAFMTIKPRGASCARRLSPTSFSSKQNAFVPSKSRRNRRLAKVSDRSLSH